MQEAYIHGYWDAFTAFMRSFFNAVFKTNSYLERAVMTGITRISKESIVYHKLHQKYSAFLMLGEKQVKVSRKDFITVSFWDLWLSRQGAFPGKE